MKRLLCAVLALFVVTALLFSFAGCGGGSDKDEDTSDSITDETEEETFFEVEDAAVKKTVLVDEADVKITAYGMAVRIERSVELMLTIENKTEKELTFRTHSASVNDVMVDTSMSATVKAGKKVYTSVQFLLDELQRSEIHAVADIELCFDVFDAESWDKYYESERVSIRTSLADESDYSYDYSGTIVYEDGELTIIAQGLTEGDANFAAGLILCVDNRTERNVTVQAYDVRLNGNPMTAIFNAEVIPDKTVAAVMRFLKSEFEKYNIEEYGKEKTDKEEEETQELDQIMSIEFTLHIFDSDTWEKIADSERITLWFEAEE